MKENYYSVLCKSFNPNSSYPKVLRLYDKKVGRFLPNGWVYEFDINNGNKNKLYSNFFFREPKFIMKPEFTLSDEQNRILEKIYSRVKSCGYASGVINMKTGRGKSLVISELIARSPGPSLILCHNEMAMKGFQEHFKKFYGITDLGYICGTGKQHASITLCTHKSFTMYPEKFLQYQNIYYDEMHKNISSSMIRALCWQQQCRSLYGFSGTPFRDDLDASDLQRIFGKEVVVEQYSTPETRYNILPQLYIEEYITPRYDYVDYQELRTAASNDEVRINKQMETLIKYVNRYNRKCSLVFTDRVAEAEMYEKKLRENPSISVVLIHGGISTADGDEALSKAKLSGKPVVIVGTIQKMGTGIDIVEIDGVFFFSPTKFNGTVIQGIGRGLRLHEGKKDVILVDWWDNDRAILHRQHLQRVRICKKEYSAVINQFTNV